MFLILFRNILCPQQMFPSAGKRHEQQCFRNNVSSFASTLMIFVWVPSSLAYALQNRVERPDYFLNFRMRRSEETVISIMLSSWPNDKQKVFCDLECKTSSIKCKQTIMISIKNSWFQILLIRTCSERGNFTFFSELFFYIAADVFRNLFNVSTCQFGLHSFF